MKTFFKFALVAVGVVSLSSCFSCIGNPFSERVVGNDSITTKEIKIDNYENVVISNGLNIIYTEDSVNPPKAKLTTSSNLHEYFTVYTENGTLRIKIKDNTSISYQTLNLEITGKNIAEVKINGSGTFDVAKKLTTNKDMKVHISGSGNFNAENVEAKSIETKISGSGNFSVRNLVCPTGELSISGSGNVKVGKFIADKAKASITGSGNILLGGKSNEAMYNITGSGKIDAKKLHAKNVEAKITGAGDISCYATGSVNKSTTGSGNIEVFGQK